MKFCSDFFETLQGYYQDKEDTFFFSEGWGALTLNWAGGGHSSQLLQCSLKLHYTLLRDGGTYGWRVLTGIDGWGALTPMCLVCLLFDVIY